MKKPACITPAILCAVTAVLAQTAATVLYARQEQEKNQAQFLKVSPAGEDIDVLDALQPEPPPPPAPTPASGWKMSVVQSGSDSEFVIEWPEGFAGLIDVYATSDLNWNTWERVLFGAATMDTNIYWAAAGQPDSAQRCFQSDDGTSGDTDGWITGPYQPDTVYSSLPPPAVSGPEGVDLGEFDPFDPRTVEASLRPDLPAINEWTRINAPGDTMAIVGEMLTATGCHRDIHFLFFGESSNGQVQAEGQIQRLDGQQCAVTLPDALPPDEMYLMWPRNNNGVGAPITINHTESWWIGPREVTRDEVFSLYGRNLILGGTECSLYIDGYGMITSTSANPYKADFTVPSDLPDGSYTVWAHNGKGQEYGWSDPLTLTVAEPFAYDGATVNVKDYGAVGDGLADDFAAISAAFDAAGSGDTIYFPAGTYLVSDTFFNLEHDKRILGDGRDVTMLGTHPSFQTTTDWGLIISEDNARNIEFSDITLSSGQYPSRGSIQYSFRGSQNLTFTNARLSQLEDLNHTGPYGNPLLAAEGTKNLKLLNCEIIQGGDITIGDADGVLIENCQFYGINDCNHMLTPIGVNNMSILNCTAQSYDNSDPADGHGWAKGRFVSGSGNLQLANRNVYFGNNATADMAPRNDPSVDSNAGEQFMFEGLVTHYRGSPVQVTSNTVQFTDLSSDWTGNIIAVISGQGLAQNRFVTGFDAATGTVTLDKPWRVLPDAESILMIGSYMSRFAVYSNYFDAHEWAVTNANEVASVGFSSYGGCFDAIVDGNTFHQVRAAIDVWSMSEPLNGTATLQPNYFNQFLNNDIVGCQVGINNRTAFWQEPYHADIGLLGNIFRNNRMNDLDLWGIAATAWKDYESIHMVVYDNNSISNTPTGINWMDHRFWGTVESPLINQVCISNTFHGGDTAVIVPRNSSLAIRHNDWGDALLVGDLPDIVNELPACMKDALVSALPVDVWNSGTAPMYWIAVEISPWLTLAGGGIEVTGAEMPEHMSARAGMITNKTSANELLFRIDAGRAAGEAIVVLVSNGQSRRLTVRASAKR